MYATSAVFLYFRPARLLHKKEAGKRQTRFLFISVGFFLPSFGV